MFREANRHTCLHILASRSTGTPKKDAAKASFILHAQPGPRNARSQTNVATKSAPHTQHNLLLTISFLY